MSHLGTPGFVEAEQPQLLGNPAGNVANPVPVLSNEQLTQEVHRLHVALQANLDFSKQLQHTSNTMQGDLRVALGKPMALKMATPEYFDGTRMKLENWIYQLRIYIFGNWAMFSDDARKIAFALTYLRGEAQDWSRPYIEAMVSQQMPPELQDFELFLAQLRAAYGDVDPKGTASNHLLELRQTGSVAEYAAKFRAYKSLSGWNADDQVYKAIFRKNLKPQVRRQIAGKEPEDTSFSDYVNWVARVDEQLRLVDQETRVANPPTRTTNQRRDPSAREVDQVRCERQAHGDCFYCGTKGHISRFCPQRTTQTAVCSGEAKAAAIDPGPSPHEQTLQTQIKTLVQRCLQEQACRASEPTKSSSNIEPGCVGGGRPLYLTISTIDRRLRRHLTFPVQISDGRRTLKATAMLDSGASSIFINSRFVQRHELKTSELEYPILLRNADNTENAMGRITHEVLLDLEVRGHQEKVLASVADIGDDELIIGIDWLRHHNPEIDWADERIDLNRCPPKCDNEKSKAQQRTAKACRTVPKARQDPNEPRRSQTTRLEDRRRAAAQLAVAELTEGLNDEPRDPENWFDLRLAAAYTHSQAIAEKTAVKEGDKTFEELVPEEFRDFARVFSKQESERLPTRKPYDHAIDLEPGSTPPYSKIYPLAPAERDALKEFIEENLQKGYIRPSKSPAAAPVFFVKKKDGSLRMVVDYRKLNAITVKNRYPLPLTTELVDTLSKSRVFTTLDLRWGYHNVRIKEGDEWKAAFRTREGHFEPTVMTFGLTNAPATFQHMMNDIFKDLIGVSVIIYLDDILIFSEDTNQHEAQVRQVLQRLADNDLFCKPEKCKFKQLEVEYLGLLISQGRIAMDPGKVRAVLDWPTPRKVKDIQAFLGFANFYRRFVKDFSKLAKPLTELLRKGVKWNWGDSQQQAFEALKRSFTEAPVLALPDLSKQFILECDASDFATGAVLSQLGPDGLVHPVAFYSKSLNEAERNYEIYDKELLAIVRALDEWRHYLEGAPERTDIVSDHKNLLYFSETRTLTRRQVRWSLFLSRFDFAIRHRPGRLGGKPDAMSRRVDHEPSDKDNTNRVLLSPNLFYAKAARRGMTQVHGDRGLLRRIRRSKRFDEELVEAIEVLQNRGPRALTKDLEDWSVEEGLMLYQGKVYVPKDEEIRRDVVRTYHDSLPAGHPGRWKTYELVSRNYWWPGMSTFVEKYVSTCDTCMRTKNIPQKPRGLLKPNDPPSNPWQHISCDFITQLPPSNGFDAILVVVDRFSKQAHFAPTTSDVDAAETANLFLQYVWKLHGTPRQVISDRGPQFVSKFLKTVFAKLGITGSTSTAYHPQTDGQTE